MSRQADPKPTERSGDLAAKLRRLASMLDPPKDKDGRYKELPYEPPAGYDHRHESTGWMLLRAGVALIDQGDRTFRFLEDWAAVGWSAATGGSEGHGKGDHADPTLARAESEKERPDEWHRRKAAWQLAVATVDRTGREVLRLHGTVWQRATDDGKPAGAGMCECCAKRYCSGAHEDRLRSGYCPACYQRWRKVGFPDRAAFERNPEAFTAAS